MNRFKIGDYVYFIENKNDIIHGYIESITQINSSLVYCTINIKQPFDKKIKVLENNLYHSWYDAKQFIKERDEKHINSLCKEIKTPEELIKFCIAEIEYIEGLEIETEVIKRKAKEFFNIGDEDDE